MPDPGVRAGSSILPMGDPNSVASTQLLRIGPHGTSAVFAIIDAHRRLGPARRTGASESSVIPSFVAHTRPASSLFVATVLRQRHACLLMIVGDALHVLAFRLILDKAERARKERGTESVDTRKEPPLTH